MSSATHEFWWGFQFLLWVACLGGILKVLWKSITHQNVRITWFGLGLTILFGLIFRPWTSLHSFKSQNPNVISWNPLYQAAAFAWICILVLAVGLISLLPQLMRRNGWLSRVLDVSNLAGWFRSLMQSKQAPHFVKASVEVMPQERESSRIRPIAFIAPAAPQSTAELPK
jgi:hypothetical protein